ncbi:TIGR03862 family flavoprotein [Phreatobacter sp.]|uniref:NAD(P)/FAD-dependent oxidoreductase n=1 Tax=Phreatobacter sp. TaxID=1966341 RepID=UPI0022BCEDAC|nr:TIGR03862 family flavoprotein [Phreatobacter sp.]MCZ8316130.1 TIGR03862 family flavoprotein [Phreatobacter sp.]
MTERPRVVIAGAGPAGLFAAGRLAEAGAEVTIYDRMASPARKFLLAGRGGLNLTHSEPREAFLSRYPDLPAQVRAAIDAFPPSALRAFAADLGQPTFVGSSGRVFPEAFKASPLLRAWLTRLASLGVTLRSQHRFVGFADDGRLIFEGPDGPVAPAHDVALLALGGASWPRMGSDGAWTGILAARGIPVRPLVASNTGIDIAWSAGFADRFAGTPLKAITLSIGDTRVRGEAMVTATGLEGGAIYALSAALRAAVAAGKASLTVDLKPDLAAPELASRLARGRSGDSLSNVLKKQGGLAPVAAAILREGRGGPLSRDPATLAAAIKGLALPVAAMRPLERAISSAGGMDRAVIGETFEIAGHPGLFAAGEMLDWDAPTGGYLLQATFATAAAAARGMAARLGLAMAEAPPPAW